MAQNLNTVAAIVLDDHLTTIKVKFQDSKPQRDPHSDSGVFTFLCPRNLAEGLAKGDKVLVERISYDGNPRLSVVEVIEIHDHAQIDPDDGITYRYAFAKVPMIELEQLKTREDNLVKRIKQQRRDTWRKQLLQDVDAERLLSPPSTPPTPVDLEVKTPSNLDGSNV